MARRLLPLALALLLIATAAPQAMAAQKKSACQKLSSKNDLAPAKDVKLVKRKNSDGGHDLVGCVLPKGKVRQAAYSAAFTTHEWKFKLREVRHAIVLLNTSESSQYGARADTEVFDIATGRRYSVAYRCEEDAIGFCSGGVPGTTAPRAFVNRKGQAAVAVASGNTITIAGFSSKGKRTPFDSGSKSDIPPASLHLDGKTVAWTHSGEHRTAQLTG
jgi:hypothetical protein